MNALANSRNFDAKMMCIYIYTCVYIYTHIYILHVCIYLCVGVGVGGQNVRSRARAIRVNLFFSSGSFPAIQNLYT